MIIRNMYKIVVQYDRAEADGQFGEFVYDVVYTTKDIDDNQAIDKAIEKVNAIINGKIDFRTPLFCFMGETPIVTGCYLDKRDYGATE